MNKLGKNHSPYGPHVKQAVIRKVRDEGLETKLVAAQYGIHIKTIYRWLKEQTPRGVVDDSRNLILENNRLRKELEQAYKVLGHLTATSPRPKD